VAGHNFEETLQHLGEKEGNSPLPKSPNPHTCISDQTSISFVLSVPRPHLAFPLLAAWKSGRGPTIYHVSDLEKVERTYLSSGSLMCPCR